MPVYIQQINDVLKSDTCLSHCTNREAIGRTMLRTFYNCNIKGN